MPATDDLDPIQDAKHARESGAIPARTPTLADLHRRWMHARLKREQAERARDAAQEALTESEGEEQVAGNHLGQVLLSQEVRGIGTRSRSRTVAIAGEVLTVCDGGAEYPGEYRITPMPVELVPLD